MKEELHTLIQAWVQEENPQHQQIAQQIQERFMADLEKMEEKQKYYCPKCHHFHLRGQIYQNHKKYAVPYPSIDPRTIKVESPYEYHHLEIVGIYYTQMGDYLANLPRKTELTLIHEQNNPHDGNAVSVWHQNQKLGYIAASENKPIAHALSKHTIHCLLGKYHPSSVRQNFFQRSYYGRRRSWRSNYRTHSEFHPERASITIEILKEQRLFQLARHYLQLLEEVPYLAICPIVESYKELGYQGFQFLSTQLDQYKHPVFKELYAAILRDYTIPIDDFKIML